MTAALSVPDTIGVVSTTSRELLEGEVDDLDAVGAGVGAGVARTQHAGQRLAGLVG